MKPSGSRIRCERLFVLVCLSACIAGCTAKPFNLPADDIEAIEIQLKAVPARQKAAKVSSKDKNKIKALLAVLRSAEETRDHKCGDSGQIILKRKDKGESKIGILAGHNESYYEFRVYEAKHYRIFRTERDSFQEAMADLGVGDLDPGLSE